MPTWSGSDSDRTDLIFPWMLGSSPARRHPDRTWIGIVALVSGRAKPAREGRLKTSHFEETQDRRLALGQGPLPQETHHGEPAQDGRPRNHPDTAPAWLVPAAD